jgi:hypothetical protein
MVEDIRLIRNWDVAHLQDVYLMVFWQSVTEKVNELLGLQIGGGVDEAESGTSQTFADEELPEKLVAAGEALLAAIEAMMQAYRKVNFKAMSEAIRKKDEERDTLLREVKTMVAAMAKMSTMPERQAAGKALQASIEQWQLDPKKEYTQEGTALRAWLEVVAQSAELTAAAEVLGLTDILARLGELNEEVSTLITDRTNEVADKKAMQQRQKRKEAERRWRTFVVVLNAAAVMDADEQRYETLIVQLNQRLKEMKKQMRHTRRMNPRKRDAEGIEVQEKG